MILGAPKRRRLPFAITVIVTLGLGGPFSAGALAGCASDAVEEPLEGGPPSVISPADGGGDVVADVDEPELPCAVGNLCRRTIPIAVGSVSTMSGRSRTDVWAAGSEGVFLHWDGQEWTRLASKRQVVETPSSLFLTPSEAWAIAGRRIVRRGLEADSVERVDIYDPEGRSLSSVVVLGDGDAYVGYTPGASTTAMLGLGKIADYDAGLLEPGPAAILPSSEEAQSISVRAMFLVPGETLWVVGDHAMVARYPVSPLAEGVVLPIATQHDLLAAWGNRDELWAVGAGGTILHFDGSTWEPQASGTPATLNAVFGLSTTDIWAAGDEGTVLHYDGHAWSRIAVRNYEQPLRAIWAAAPDDVWIGGERAIFHWGPLP